MVGPQAWRLGWQPLILAGERGLAGGPERRPAEAGAACVPAK